MKKPAILFFTILLFINSQLKSQTPQDSETNSNIKKAVYLKEDLKNDLWKNLEYPFEAVTNKIQGDVILSFDIDKSGKIGDMMIVSSADKSLSISSLASFDGIGDDWSPSKVNGNPVDKTYLLIYRYRIWQSFKSPEYDEKAQKLIEKEKYEKALKIYDRAIEENQYDYQLFEARSKISEMLGDTIAAKNDSEQANRLQNEIMLVIDVPVVSRQVTRYMGSTITTELPTGTRQF